MHLVRITSILMMMEHATSKFARNTMSLGWMGIVREFHVLSSSTSMKTRKQENCLAYKTLAKIINTKDKMAIVIHQRVDHSSTLIPMANASKISVESNSFSQLLEDVTLRFVRMMALRSLDMMGDAKQS